MVPILRIINESFMSLLSVAASHEVEEHCHEQEQGRVTEGNGAVRGRLTWVESRKAGFKEQLEGSKFLKHETDKWRTHLLILPVCVIALKSDKPYEAGGHVKVK